MGFTKRSEGVPRERDEDCIQRLEQENSALKQSQQEKIKAVRVAAKVVGLLNSMVEGREDHSEQSREDVSKFFELL